MFAYRVAHAFKCFSVYALLDTIEPDELDNWMAFYKIKAAETTDVNMQTPEAFLQRVAHDFQDGVE